MLLYCCAKSSFFGEKEHLGALLLSPSLLSAHLAAVLRARNPYDMSHKEPKVDKSGWLYKQGEARKSWKKRFMKLCGDKLYYYSSPKVSPCSFREGFQGPISFRSHRCQQELAQRIPCTWPPSVGKTAGASGGGGAVPPAALGVGTATLSASETSDAPLAEVMDGRPLLSLLLALLLRSSR